MLLDDNHDEMRITRKLLHQLSIPIHDAECWDSKPAREEYIEALVEFSKTLP